MRTSDKIQLAILVVMIVGVFVSLITGLWNNNVDGLIIVAYALIYLLFVLVGILLFKVYGKNNKPLYINKEGINYGKEERRLD